MAYSNFDKLKSFFLALNKSGYHPERMDPEIITPKDKAYCFDWLRDNTPDLKGKDDNYISEYLRDPKKVKGRILGEGFTQEEGAELAKALEEEPDATEEAGGQEAGQETPPEQAMPTGQEGAFAGGMPGMPSGPAFSKGAPRIIHEVPQVQKPEIAIANKSGYVAEKPPTEFHVTDSAGNIQATYSKNPAPVIEAPQSKLVTTSGGAIKEGPGNASKLVSASGNEPLIKTTTPTSPTQSLPPKEKLNFSALRSKVGNRVSGAIKSGLEKANPYLGRAGTRLANNLMSIANPGGMGRVGSKSIIRRLGGFGKDSGAGGKSLLGKAKTQRGLMFAGGLIASMAFVGLLTITSSTSTGEAAPLPSGAPGATDISSCKFTRGDQNPKEAKFQSGTLLSYIQEAAQKSSIPAVVLASFIRVESPSSSNMSNDQIANYSNNCAKSPTGALGIMQIQPPGTTSAAGDPASCDDCIDAGAKLVGKTVSTLTEQDYCDPKTNIIVGAGWILKKMSKLGYGDGTKWDPGWTNNKEAIKALVNTYYGCLIYGGVTDCTGSFNYADDVSNSIQSCQQTTPPYQPGAGKGIISCPLNNPATITNGSNDAGGHCSNTYEQDYGICAKIGETNYTGKETAIDVTSLDKMVYLPKLNNTEVNWVITEIDTNTGYINNGATVNGGYSVKAKASSNGKDYEIRFVHMNPPQLNPGSAKSGDLVGTYRTQENHVHITVKEDQTFQVADKYFNLCTL